VGLVGEMVDIFEAIRYNVAAFDLAVPAISSISAQPSVTCLQKSSE
jgi:hypothetical protein